MSDRRIQLRDFVGWARENGLPLPDDVAGPVIAASADPQILASIAALGSDVRSTSDWPGLAAAVAEGARGLILDASLGWEESARFVAAFASLPASRRCPIVCLVPEGRSPRETLGWGATLGARWPIDRRKIRQLFW
jgi:hypothetical protein